ncbi:MAG TPA: 3'-5' exonuclease, partial [Polyangiaceae bacterium]|nr:3'-5' exonuclease [Polyangiaceae bacterium]
ASHAQRLRSKLACHPDATARRILEVLDNDTVASLFDRIGFEAPAPPSPADHPRTRESRFVAIDFETADSKPDSACSVALVRVHGQRIVKRAARLIRPPRRQITLTWVHGITWQDVAEAPTFRAVWLELAPILEGTDFLVAHHAPFDRAVLRACCQRARLPMPSLPFKCTVKWSRRMFDLPRYNLPTVCDYLGIALDHHQALSDAEACARIMIEVQRRWQQRDVSTAAR